MALLEQTVGDALRAAAAEAAGHIAIVEGTPGPGPRRKLTYAELLAAAEQVARALLARFRPGEHVAVWSANSLEWILLEFGAGLAGLVLVTVNPAYEAAELGYVLRQSRSAGLIHAVSYRGKSMACNPRRGRVQLPDLREVVALEDWEEFLAAADPDTTLPAVRPHDFAQIQYTSGTTGSPRGYCCTTTVWSTTPDSPCSEWAAVGLMSQCGRYRCSTPPAAAWACWARCPPAPLSST